MALDASSDNDRPGPAPGTPWANAQLALALLAINPQGLGGLWLMARAGPMRDRLLAQLAAFAPQRLHPAMPPDSLAGGMDIAETLLAQAPRWRPGLLAKGGWAVLSSAERTSAATAAMILDQARKSCATGQPTALVALDESATEAEALPSPLAEALGLFADLDGLALADCPEAALPMDKITAAQAILGGVTLAEDALAAIAETCQILGIASPRAALFCMAAARAHAALHGRHVTTAKDLEIAAALALAHRATRQPEAPQDQAPTPPEASPSPPPPAPQADDAQDRAAQDDPAPDTTADAPQPDPATTEMLIASAQAALPHDLLARLQAGRIARQMAKGAAGAGARQASQHRGRPLPPRSGRPGTGQRVDIFATLRQAAPWQKIRRAAVQAAQGTAGPQLLIWPRDIQLKRFQARQERALFFLVDASGSAAVARLAEAKGAIELMLAQAYARRDHVALITFRGTQAELALPPTRALVQAKRRLAGLPGGGATPLAGALDMARACVAQARARGQTPALAVLTDGRGNIALDGSANRQAAQADTTRMAQALRAMRVPALVLDTSMRPRPDVQTLATALGAELVRLPRADAQGLSATLGAALGRDMA
jgi:magnesium chelatase subunit D